MTADNSNDIQRCPAGGPGCESRTRQWHFNTGPMGVQVGYFTCPRCGWVSEPFTPRPGRLMPAASLTDQLGRPIAVGARVVPVDALGTVLWSCSGRVTGLGRTLVHVRWEPRAVRPGAEVPRRARRKAPASRGMMSSATAPADK